MPTKALSDAVWTADAPEGSLTATFARFGGPPDLDGDITLPTAFEDGKALAMCWAHHLDEPVGKGRIRVEPDRAVFDGQFFLTTTRGRDAYETVKSMADLQEWSYTYEPLETEQGTFEGKPVRLLKRVATWEISPVLKGAGRQTQTEAIKAADLEEKPFPSEHSCRLAEPSRYDRFRRVNNDRQHDGKQIDVIYGHPTAGGGWEQQALRLPTSDWDAAAARSYCSSHEGSFEAAKDEHALLEDARSLVVAEAKIGRPISAARRQRIAAWRDALHDLRQELDDLLTETDPSPLGVLEDGKRLFLDFQRTVARLNGVLT